jgi:hypothetical protein
MEEVALPSALPAPRATSKKGSVPEETWLKSPVISSHLESKHVFPRDKRNDARPTQLPDAADGPNGRVPTPNDHATSSNRQPKQNSVPEQ